MSTGIYTGRFNFKKKQESAFIRSPKSWNNHILYFTASLIPMYLRHPLGIYRLLAIFFIKLLSFCISLYPVTLTCISQVRDHTFFIVFIFIHNCYPRRYISGLLAIHDQSPLILQLISDFHLLKISRIITKSTPIISIEVTNPIELLLDENKMHHNTSPPISVELQHLIELSLAEKKEIANHHHLRVTVIPSGTLAKLVTPGGPSLKLFCY